MVDAVDRENEGDFVCAAEKVTPEIVNFMITHGRGQLCMPILPEVSRRLELRPDGRGQHGPARHEFYRPRRSPLDSDRNHGRRTGDDHPGDLRSATASRPTLVRPGHLFPLVAKEGGVLRRAGHTEAAVDLARMAGLAPAGVLCEILDEKATGQRRDELRALADGAAPADHFHRATHRLSPRPRETRLPQSRGQAADPLRHWPHHCLWREIRNRRSRLPLSSASPRKSAAPLFGCIPPASPATCSNRSAATAAPNSTWPSI